MHINLKQNRAAKGFTLTEAAIVLGIVGLILGAIWVAAAAVYTNMRVETANKQLLSIVQNVRSLYASSTSMDDASMQSLAAAGVFPSDTSPDATAGTAKNGWGGNIRVARVAAGGQCAVAGSCFSVEFAGLPQAACIKMGVGNSGHGRDAGLVGAGSSAITDGSTGIDSAATPTYFSTNGCGAGQSLFFTYKLKG